MKYLIGILIFATSLYILMTHVKGQNNLRIGFTEVDFSQTENNGSIIARIQKEGDLMSDLFLNIIPLTYAQFDAQNYTLPPERRDDVRPDPAEYEAGSSGRKDFDNEIKQVLLTASDTRDDYTVAIPIVPDSINEADEGFMLVMTVNEARSSINMDEIAFLGGGVALAKIKDDDSITIMFEYPSYTFKEVTQQFDDTIYVIKHPESVTEQVISLLVRPFSISATKDQDYIAKDTYNLEFLPGKRRLPISVIIIEDVIPEPTESFQLILKQIEDTPGLELEQRGTKINIKDDDDVEVGVEFSVYSITEGETITVCARITGPDKIDEQFLILATLNATNVGSAILGKDFIIVNNIIFLSSNERRSCVTIEALKDVIFEGTENITLTIIPNNETTPPNVAINGDITIQLNSDECSEGTDDCVENAQCVDTVEGFDCVCLPGFTGNGKTLCEDINECALRTDNCSRNIFCTRGSNGRVSCTKVSACVNTPGSFTCSCGDGYTGDGYSCKDKNECSTGTDNCSENAVCRNYPGSYLCNCLKGFEGNGFFCFDVNECALGIDACSDVADCFNTPGSYNCQCPQGYTGDGFSCVIENILNNECLELTHDCGPNSLCFDLVVGFGCQCLEGFTGNGKTCIDINECAINKDDCLPNANCINTEGSYNCVCKTGYVGDGRICRDFDECSAGTDKCHENAICVNVVGGYGCTCKTGFTGDGLNCVDLNECAERLDNCHLDAFCTNTLGSFTCLCRLGFSGDGTVCTAANAASLSNPCGHSAEPMNQHLMTESSYTRYTTKGTHKSHKSSKSHKRSRHRRSKSHRSHSHSHSSKSSTYSQPINPVAAQAAAAQPATDPCAPASAPAIAPAMTSSTHITLNTHYTHHTHHSHHKHKTHYKHKTHHKHKAHTSRTKKNH